MILQHGGRCSAVGSTDSYPLKHASGRKYASEESHQPQVRWVALALTEGIGKKRLPGSSCVHTPTGAGQVQDRPRSTVRPCAEVTLTRAMTPEMNTVGLGGLENRKEERRTQ